MQARSDLFDPGADVITLGHHAWDKRETATYIDQEPRLIRPVDFPPGTAGFGSFVVKRGGQPLMAVVQAHGRVFTPLLLEDPFRGLEEVLERLRHVTHTHVRSADELILPCSTVQRLPRHGQAYCHSAHPGARNRQRGS